MADRSRAIFQTALERACAAIGLSLSDAQVDRLEAHFRRMVEANRRFNLTRITAPREAAVRHYADALSVVAWSQRRARKIRKVLDVGTGAGLPAVALAVARPDWHVTAIDAHAKKAHFVSACAAALDLANLDATQQHTRQWRDCADRFDLITFRAVGKLADCITQARPFLAPGGMVVCYKSQRIPDEERADGTAAARRAKLMPLSPWPYDLPLGSDRLKHLLLAHQRT